MSQWPCEVSNHGGLCGNIQPVDVDWKNDQDPNKPKPVEKLYPTFTKSGGLLLPIALAIGAIVAALAWWRSWVPGKRLGLGFISFSLILVALALFRWDSLAGWLTSDGEPIALFDGVSLWPTILLRIIGIVLAIYFICRTQRELNDNLKGIATEMSFGINSPTLSAQIGNLLKSCPFVFFRDRRRAKENLESPIEVKAVWEAYADHELFLHRLVRAVFFTIFMFLFTYCVLFIPFFGRPSFPYRGDIAWWVYKITITFDWLLMQILIFIVFDATWSCLVFVKKLGRETSWPTKTLNVYNGRLRITPAKHIYDWIDLDFVAKRTRCISSLVYLPFVLIALVVVSRSTLFANYPPSITIIASQGIGLSFVFSCAFMLWQTAKTTPPGISCAKVSSGPKYGQFRKAAGISAHPH
jgi:hypothetical protein